MISNIYTIGGLLGGSALSQAMMKKSPAMETQTSTTPYYLSNQVNTPYQGSPVYGDNLMWLNQQYQ